MDISEGAAARLLPYFLDGIAREEYRSHMGRAPPEVDIYPYMIQFLLSRFAVDEVLVEAYLGVTQCKALEGESEQAYGRRLYKAAIRAGNVVSMEDLDSCFLKACPRGYRPVSGIWSLQDSHTTAWSALLTISGPPCVKRT